jgi:hypothetical protein
MSGATHTNPQCHIREDLNLEKSIMGTSGIAGRSNTFIELYQNKTFSSALKQNISLLLEIKQL